MIKFGESFLHSWERGPRGVILYAMPLRSLAPFDLKLPILALKAIVGRVRYCIRVGYPDACMIILFDPFLQFCTWEICVCDLYLPTGTYMLVTYVVISSMSVG